MPFFFGREFQLQGDPYFSGAAGEYLKIKINGSEDE